MSDTIRTEAQLLDIFKDAQPASSLTAQDVRDFIVTAQYLQPLGWEFVFDSQYASGSPESMLTLADGVPDKVTLTSNPGQELRHPPGFPGIWDDTDHMLHPPLLNGFGILRLSFFGKYVGGTAPYVNLSLDVGSDPVAPAGTGTAANIIYVNTQPFAKASGESQAFNYIIPLFIGSDFSINGGHFIVEAVGDDVDIYDISLTGVRTYAPNPAV